MGLKYFNKRLLAWLENLFVLLLLVDQRSSIDIFSTIFLEVLLSFVSPLCFPRFPLLHTLFVLVVYQTVYSNSFQEVALNFVGPFLRCSAVMSFVFGWYLRGSPHNSYTLVSITPPCSSMFLVMLGFSICSIAVF